MVKGAELEFQENFEIYILIARRLKALADPTRLGIIHLLCESEMKVNSLVEASGFSQARISKHLRILREEKLVTSRRENRNIFYSMHNDFPRRICELVFESLECSNRDDQELLKKHEEVF
jgi:ArsR family transcriptional regulator